MSSSASSFQQNPSKREWDVQRERPQHDPGLSSASGSLEDSGAMDVDIPEGSFIPSQRYSGSKELSRRPSWHSEGIPREFTGDNPPSSSSLSRSVSLSDNHSTSPDDTLLAEKGADDPAFHAAYRLFKASIKQASEKYGPFLPPDDGSPFLALRLHRLWQDLSREQRLVYFARATSEGNSDNMDASQRAFNSYSPRHLSTQSVQPSPPSTGVSTTRTHFPVHGSPEMYHTNINTPELRSPVSFMDDDPTGPMRSRSQSPHVGDEGSAQMGRVPRPPNAWILFRATMSKSKRPDGLVYSPPEISVMWKNLDAAEREHWFEQAKQAKQQHEVANPGYKYRPNRTRLQGVRKLTEGSGAAGGGSSSSSSTKPLAGPRSHPAPSPPSPPHTRF